MNQQSWILRNKWTLTLLSLPVLIGAWWAFRPEKLFINEKVSEPPPFASNSEPQPIFTGKLAGSLHQTSGRATIYQNADGKRTLRLTDFSTSSGPDVHVLLARANDPNLLQEIVKGDFDTIELGSLKGNQGDQNYDLPISANLAQYQAIVVYCERFHAIFGVAKLEQF